MNFSLYVFGSLNGNYDQFPRDNNHHLFRDFASKRQGKAQLTIHRQERLVYYVGVYDLSKSNAYFGIGVIFNGVYCRETKILFELFEKVFSDVALNGEILGLDKYGKVAFTIDKFNSKPQEVERIKTLIQDGFQNLPVNSFVVTDTSFKVGNGTKSISISEENTKLTSAVQQFDCVQVVKKERPDSELDKLHKTLSDLYSEKKELSLKYKKLVAQKKNYRLVFALCMLVIIVMIVMMNYRTSLQSRDNQIGQLKSELNDKSIEITNLLGSITELEKANNRLNDENSVLKNDIRGKKYEIDVRDNEISSLNGKIAQLESDNSDFKTQNFNLRARNNELYNEKTSLDKEKSSWNKEKKKLLTQLDEVHLYPILIKSLKIGNTYKDGSVETRHGNMLYSSNSMYLSPKIDYVGVTTKRKITVYVRIYKNGELTSGASSPTGYSYSQEIDIQKSEEMTLMGWGSSNKGHWSRGQYRCEIWHNNMCVKAVDFTLN